MMFAFSMILVACLGSYCFGFWDGYRNRGPAPLRGNYEHCEEHKPTDEY